MPNYRETTVAGTAWVRSNQVMIDNPLNGTPTVHYREERVINTGDEVISRTEQGMNFPFDPNEEISVLNPMTDEPTGMTVTGAQIYAILYSHYRKRAAERDAAAP